MTSQRLLARTVMVMPHCPRCARCECDEVEDLRAAIEAPDPELDAAIEAWIGATNDPTQEDMP